MTYAKAIVAFLLAFLAVVLTALTTGDQVISSSEWIAAIVSGLGTFTGTYAIPNRSIVTGSVTK